MLEKHLKVTVTCQRLRRTIADPYLDGLAEWFYKQGFKPIVIELRLRSLASFLEWMQERNYTIKSIVKAHSECKKELDKGRVLHSRGVNKDSILAASKLIAYLREINVLKKLPPKLMPYQKWQILADFRFWSIENKGMKETTLDLYETCLRDLVQVLGTEPTLYNTKSIRNFVINRSKGHTPARAQAIGVATRSFLRYLFINKKVKEDLSLCVPKFSAPRLKSAPRYITSEEIKKVEKSCHTLDENGLRDRAVILLLTRLGLRASDIANLEFDDIDWNNGKLCVSGKSRRKEWLPLPQEVGDAIFEYIKNGRSKFNCPQVFIRVDAPIRPLNRASVTHIARSAYIRAGVKPEVNGAHTLRHSAATLMLKEGVSLAGIGAVLRHRSFDTTGIYAKVDFKILSEVAIKWPKVVIC
jgi:site-specific recombinase XerD